MWVVVAKGSMSEVACPIDLCDYEGATESVEAHISAMTDALHKGAVGREYRGDLLADGGEVGEAVESASSGSTSPSTSGDASEGGGLPVPSETWQWALLAILDAVGGYLLYRKLKTTDEPDQEKDEREEPIEGRGLTATGGVQ